MTQRTMLGITVGLFVAVMLTLLVPYAAIGESWGMVWMYAAFPFSFLFEDWFGIGRGSHLLIFTASCFTAGLWAVLLLGVLNLIAFMIKFVR